VRSGDDSNRRLHSRSECRPAGVTARWSEAETGGVVRILPPPPLL